jgi:hypothetical protein
MKESVKALGMDSSAPLFLGGEVFIFFNNFTYQSKTP